MRTKRLAILLLMILSLLLPFSVLQASSTLTADGIVDESNVFSNSAGITFMVPDEHYVSYQKMKDAGFLRVIITPINEGIAKPHIVLDFRKKSFDIEGYGAEQYLDELVSWPINPSKEKYSEPFLLAFGVLNRSGVTVQQTMAGFHYSRRPADRPYVYCCSNAWCTESYYTRVTIFKFYDVDGLGEDYAILQAVCDSLSVP